PRPQPEHRAAGAGRDAAARRDQEAHPRRPAARQPRREREFGLAASPGADQRHQQRKDEEGARGG
ncbi:MAG: hypothetical protein ACK56I_24615, partial [bacterium]